MSLPTHVDIVEVGLRDGLQSEATILPTEKKLDIIEKLVDAGLTRIQVVSFVHPKYVPQMADAEALCAGLQPHERVVYSGLVLNQKGVERAAAAGIKHIDMGLSASETHSQKNANRSVDEAMREFEDMVALARDSGMTVRGGIQCAFGCAYEGAVDPQRVQALATQMLALGVDELALADSTGMANPVQMRRMMDTMMKMAGNTTVVLHLHDTRGLGLANVYAALESGVTQFDTAFGGMGGCPFIKGATGNIATEDTLYLLEEIGIETGIDRVKIAEITREMQALIGHDLPGKLYRLETL